MVTEELVALRVVVEALEALGVDYALGGSWASALHGVVRATMDAGLVAALRPEHAAPLARALSRTFYADADAIREAIRDRDSFNVIHLDTMFKVDVFVAGSRPFDHAQLARSQWQTLIEDPLWQVRVLSPEDTILAKLEWYRRGGETSDRQWRDLLGVIKVQGEGLDGDYLRRMGSELGVGDLLARAMAEAR